MNSICPNCNTAFDCTHGNRRFCSRKCNNKFHNDLRDREEIRLRNKQRGSAYFKLNNIFRNYGITKEQFEWLLEDQKGLCAICGLYLNNDINIDHDHKKELSSSVRGIVHRTCNSAIGLLKDDPSICRKAADYLERGNVSFPC